MARVSHLQISCASQKMPREINLLMQTCPRVRSATHALTRVLRGKSRTSGVIRWYCAIVSGMPMRGSRR